MEEWFQSPEGARATHNGEPADGSGESASYLAASADSSLAPEPHGNDGEACDNAVDLQHGDGGDNLQHDESASACASLQHAESSADEPPVVSSAVAIAAPPSLDQDLKRTIHNPLMRGIYTSAFHQWDADGNHIGWVGVKEWRASILDMLGMDVPLSTSYTWRKAEQAS